MARVSIDPARADRRCGLPFALVVLALGACVGCANVLGIDRGIGEGDGGGSGDSSDASPGAEGSAAEGSVAAPDAGCSAGQKSCNGACVNVADPSYGCAPTSCGACSPVMNATVTCSGGVCGHACQQGYVDCAGTLCSCGAGNLCLSGNTCGPCRVKLQPCQVNGDCCGGNCGGTLTCL